MNDLDLLKCSAYFDADFYRERYPDVTHVDPIEHYLMFGGLEGRWPSAYFDPNAYWDAYPDVRKAGVNPLLHFLRHGLAERRWASVAPSAPVAPDIRALTANDREAIESVAASQLFDANWYARTYGPFNAVEPAAHYVIVGASLGYAPGPDFDGAGYTRLHPDIGDINPLLHYERHGQSEGRALGATAAVKEVLRRELRALGALEPDLLSDSRLYGTLETLPAVFSMPRNSIAASWRRLWSDIGPEVDHLVFIPWLVRGGADMAAVNVLKALQHRFGMAAVAIVSTDYADAPAIDWLPEGSKFVRFAEVDTLLSPGDRSTLVERLLWALRPRSVFNVNSRACWEATAQKGQALARMTQLNALLFCRDFSADGRPVGYSDTHFRPSLPHLHRVFFDTRYFMSELIDQFGLATQLSRKLQYLPQPAAAAEQLVSLASTMPGRPRVLWAGRLVRQKNTALLLKIMAEATHFDFDVWGSGDPTIERELNELAMRAGNVCLRGSFASLEDVPLGSYTAFLFTSHYEGMPTIILNIAASGLPIVATAVGGVGDVVDQWTGWPVADRENAEPYLQALNEVTANPGLVSRKRNAMNERLSRERSLQGFERELFSGR